MNVRRILKSSAVAALFVLLFGVSAVAQIHFDLESPANGKAGIPGNCSTWHELYPVYCQSHHQVAYEDNGDTVISECDNITLEDEQGNVITCHIETVVPTYFLSGSDPSQEMVVEGEVPPGTSPVCQTWHEVYPNHCQPWHVDEWEDANTDGVVSECDFVVIGGVEWHIDRIGIDIIADPGSPAQEGTWGHIKSFFGQIF
jgi:hypothetical protein